MIKINIPYTDYNENQRNEDFYFNLSKFEAAELAVELPDNVSDVFDINEENNDVSEATSSLIEKLGYKGIMDFIKTLVRKAYGVKSSDGKRFIKSKELYEEFEQSPAYSEFMMRLLSDEKAASDFVAGIIPTSLVSD